jgi:hypothetical protein
MTVEVELRCPLNESRLLAKILADPTAKIVEGNLVEVACDHCKSVRRKAGEADVLRVLHRFNVLGASVETEIVR